MDKDGPDVGGVEQRDPFKTVSPKLRTGFMRNGSLTQERIETGKKPNKRDGTVRRPRRSVPYVCLCRSDSEEKKRERS